jgi:hypothetical protein
VGGGGGGGGGVQAASQNHKKHAPKTRGLVPKTTYSELYAGKRAQRVAKRMAA